MIGQPIRGLVGQGMNGRRPISTSYSYPFPAGSYTFTPPSAGRWKFVAWSGGGTAPSVGGGSGAYGEITRPLTPGQPVTIVVGASEGNTSLTFSDGLVSTLVGASTTTAGTASGAWDTSLAGTIGSGTGAAGSGDGGGAAGPGVNGGSGAPGRLPFRGGAGGDPAADRHGHTPGGGGGNGTGGFGGEGMVIAYLVSF